MRTAALIAAARVGRPAGDRTGGAESEAAAAAAAGETGSTEFEFFRFFFRAGGSRSVDAFFDRADAVVVAVAVVPAPFRFFLLVLPFSSPVKTQDKS